MSAPPQPGTDREDGDAGRGAARVVVSGATGRMGRAIARLLDERADLRCLGGIARSARGDGEASELGCPRVVGADDADGTAALLSEADVVVDASAPAQLERLLTDHLDALEGRGLVTGTTGLSSEQEARIDRAAERCAVLVAANFSVGVNVLLALVEHAAAALDATRYDAEVVELHHRRKADAPSGTALALGRILADARGASLDAIRRDGRTGATGERAREEVGFHAVRGGDVVGEHRVLFLGERERIELAHAAQDRSLFAEGAVLAARWLVDRPPGRYAMADALGLRVGRRRS